MFTKHLFNLFGLFLCLTVLSGSIMATSSTSYWGGNSRKKEASFFEKANRIVDEHPIIVYGAGTAVTAIVGLMVWKNIIPISNTTWRTVILLALGGVFGMFLACTLISLTLWLFPEQHTASHRNSLSFGSRFSMSSSDTVRGLEEVPPGQMGLILDLILLLLILLGAFRGYKNGLFSQLFSSVAILVFLIFGRPLFDNTVTMLSHWWPALDEGSIHFLTIMVLFMCLLFVVFVLERILKRILQLTFLGYFDSLLGAVLGVVQTSFFLATLIFLIELYGVTLSEEYTANMRIYNTIHSFVPRCMALFQEYFPMYLSWLTEK